MNLANVRLILAREIRDQLRDRRTMFMIFVLPILLYPLMGLSFLQISQFMQTQPLRVLIVGGHHLDALNPLFANEGFQADLFTKPEDARLLRLTFLSDEPPQGGPPPSQAELRERVFRSVLAGEYDAGVIFPDDFAQRLEAFRQQVVERARARQDSAAASAEAMPSGDDAPTAMPPHTSDPNAPPPPAATASAERPGGPEVPSPEIIYNTANEKSLVARDRVGDVMWQWVEQIGARNLAQSGVPAQAARPFSVETADVAEKVGLRGAATWAKLLPMLLVLWAMTGAFYPAVDLCAGEKERGTLETLLSSPAQRSEIVLGKLLTIMLFSVATAMLNIVSIGLTGLALIEQLPGMGPPPAIAMLWLPLALAPVSALFGALCLALAALARSTKEGQYYLMPLMLVTMPLVMLPMSSGVELTLGNSLIPVMGLVLLLRELLEGQVAAALPYFLPVGAVTLACCLLAVRWAVDQFNRETVLFRESERLDLGLRLRRMLHEKEPTPSPTAAVTCGVLILVVSYFFNLALKPPTDFGQFARIMIATQLAVVVMPPVLMALFFTNNARRTLLLRLPRWSSLPTELAWLAALPAAVALAVIIHPAANALRIEIIKVFPVSNQLRQALEHLQEIISSAPLWQVLLLMAVLPALCEELAFRGFILSGLRRTGYPLRAILVSAFFFACVHSILQQSINAFLLGLVLALLAIRTGSILPGIFFHVTHNALAMSISRLSPAQFESQPALSFFAHVSPEQGIVYHPWVVVASIVLGGAILLWLVIMPFERNEEEMAVAAMRRMAEEPVD